MDTQNDPRPEPTIRDLEPQKDAKGGGGKKGSGKKSAGKKNLH